MTTVNTVRNCSLLTLPRTDSPAKITVKVTVTRLLTLSRFANRSWMRSMNLRLRQHIALNRIPLSANEHIRQHIDRSVRLHLIDSMLQTPPVHMYLFHGTGTGIQQSVSFRLIRSVSHAGSLLFRFGDLVAPGLQPHRRPHLFQLLVGLLGIQLPDRM